MPHDAIITGQQVLPKTTFGGNDRVLLQKYIAPASADGGIADDPYFLRDRDTARLMSDWLEREYPGHKWVTTSDIAQGVVYFNLAILMGTDKWWVVNLRTHDIIDGMKRGAGQLLERYKLPRGRFDLDSFLEARAKHSRLLVPSRGIPE